jgi:hypothetical protein
MQDGTLVVQNTEQAKPYADRAHALSDLKQDPEMKLAGYYPMVMIEKYLNDHNITMHEFLKDPEHARRMLNDPDLAAFRVWKGKV